jgi:hypothetical protein
LWGLVLAGSFCVLYELSTHSDKYQWDLKVYYSAAVAPERGVDAYDPRAMSRQFGTSQRLPFIYPPMWLKAFSLLTSMEYTVLYQVWLLLKLTAFVGLIWLWKKYFVQNGLLVAFLLFVLLSFDASTLLDFKSGNIAVYEQLSLWLAFLMLVRGRTGVFCSLVVLMALIKLTPIVFLLFLFVPGVAQRWKHLGISVAVFGYVLLLNWVFWPQMSSRYVHNVFAIQERGVNFNYATLPFLRDLSDRLSPYISWAPEYLAYIAYVVVIVVIGVVTLVGFRKLKYAGRAIDRRQLIMLGCVLFAIVMPHMKGYSYMLLIVPSYVLMCEYLRLPGAIILWLLCLLPIGNFMAPWVSTGLVMSYYPLLLAYLMWGAYLYYLSQLKQKPTL